MYDLIVESYVNVLSPRWSLASSDDDDSGSGCLGGLFRPKVQRLSQRTIDSLCRIRESRPARSIAILRRDRTERRKERAER